MMAVEDMGSVQQMAVEAADGQIAYKKPKPLR
jgi:hypothetical protein